jgi:PERQ amino acid-rich with GYF domain-containing protein
LSSSDASFGQSQQQYIYQGVELISEGRFSKNKLLDIYKSQQDTDQSSNDVTRLFMDNWDPAQTNGSNGRGWGKSSDTRDQNYGPEVCWDQSGQVQPINLEEMSELEKMVSSSIYLLGFDETKLWQIFSGDINSPLKPPPQNANKDQNTPGASNGRKASISHGGQGGSSSFGLTSPTTTRPTTRRRETSDSVPYSSLASPGGTGRFNRDEASPFLSRKPTDTKDSLYGTSGLEDRPDEGSAGNVTSKMALPFGGLMRSNTGGNSLANGPTSPWGTTPASATLSPMGNFGSFAMPGQQPALGEKRPGFGTTRGESRLVSLMPRESSEDLMSKSGEANKAQESSRPWRSRPRTDTDPFGDESGAPEEGQDIASLLSQQRRAPGLDTPNRQISSDFGMSDMPGFRDSANRRDEAQQTPQGHHGAGHEQFSPTDTNPYGSPATGERDEMDHAVADSENMQHMRGHALGGIPENGPNHYGTLPRGFAAGTFDGSDRSQNSSAGASKPFPSLGGLSGLGGLGGYGGWPTTSNPIGTPDRERSNFQGAFGNTIFGPMGDMQSPSLGNLGGTFGGGSSGNLSASNTIGRGSKLGSLFPAAMQAQMQGTESEIPGEGVDHRQNSAFGAIGRNAIGSNSRDTESPMRSGRGTFDDPLQASESRGQGSVSSAELSQTLTSPAPHTAPSYAPAPTSAPNYQPSQGSSDSASSSLPPTQQRTMVMPDRMRWVYLDPQGQVQGPWSGLEMHDWYKASFFTADLSVKKVEDAEFEPLGQLIRRIGNSREPFLVPQIGVPHGPATTQAGPPFAPTTATSGAALSQQGTVQPPFASAFPSFGTTLTAEQQNNLERRKQEEQYLMARQREFLAQQQVTMKQLQMQGAIPSALHHHSSAHSLQSQPSFGSITSPIGMQPQAQLPGTQNFFDGVSRQGGGPGGMAMPQDFLREEEMARLSIQERQQAFVPGISGPQMSQTQQLPSIVQQQSDSQRDATRMEQMRQNDPQGFKARLREFEQLRAQHELEQSMHASTATSVDPVGQPQQRPIPQSFREKMESQAEEKSEVAEPEVLSLTEQVQKAASAKQTPVAQADSPWGKLAAGLPMPFPPPQSATPLPAPTAVRGRSNLPEALNMGSRSRSETPDMPGATPSVAPWAKEQAETPKGPSLKEIQEAEAKKAAKAEEAAAAARRALLEQEMRNQPVTQAPGLPTTSTWGSSASPVTPVNAPSAWAKPAAKTQASTAATASSKKTLTDIQKEEELRKQKIAAASAATAIPGQSSSSGGKRYADLAGKPTNGPGPSVSAAWSTVGAGGKIKTPTGPSVSTPSTTMRSATTTSVPTVASTKLLAAARPVTAATRSMTGNGSTGQTGFTAANQEFTKWAKNELSRGLNTGINGKLLTNILGG